MNANLVRRYFVAAGLLVGGGNADNFARRVESQVRADLARDPDAPRLETPARRLDEAVVAFVELVLDFDAPDRPRAQKALGILRQAGRLDAAGRVEALPADAG